MLLIRSRDPPYFCTLKWRLGRQLFFIFCFRFVLVRDNRHETARHMEDKSFGVFVWLEITVRAVARLNFKGGGEYLTSLLDDSCGSANQFFVLKNTL